jgi:hypothetical protein
MSNVASQPFDPYHKWLGIAPAEQPPTWYRLLGIPLFESDPDVIDAAADQRMAHLRKYQTGANSALSQQLLNEVASARIGLLSPEKKASYDADLRARTAAAGSAGAAKPVVQGAGESSATGRGKADSPSTGRRPPKLQVAVPLDSPTPVAAAPVPVPGIQVPVVKSPPVTSGTDAPAADAFTPVPMARRATQPKPQSMAGLIVGFCVAAGIGLLGLVWWMVQGQGASRPIGPTIAESAGSHPEAHSTVDAVTPAPVPKAVEPPKEAAAPSPVAPAPPSPTVPPPSSPAVSAPPATTEKPAAEPAATPPAKFSRPKRQPRATGAILVRPAIAGDFRLERRAIAGLQVPVVAKVSFAVTAEGGKELPPSIRQLVVIGSQLTEKNQEGAMRMTETPEIQVQNGGPPITNLIHEGAVSFRPQIRYFRRAADRSQPMVELVALSTSPWVTPMEQNCEYLVRFEISAAGLEKLLGLLGESGPPPQVAGPAGTGPSATQETAPKPAEPPKETAPAVPVRPATPAAEIAPRAAVPDDAALTKASKEVFDIYSAEYDAARSATQKTALAKKFLEQAAAAGNGPAVRYVLLKAGRDLASQSGDAAVAFQAIDELNAVFDVDGTGMKVEALSKAVKAAQTPALLKSLVEQILALVDELVDQDRFDEGLKLIQVASSRALRAHDNPLLKQVNQHKKEVEAIRKAFAEVQPLAERLGTQPDDAEANYRVGRYSAAVKNDWKKGLPMLAKGSDASWRKLAQQEQASPAAADGQLALADGWWEAAQSASDAEKNGLLLHAGTWYRKAQPTVAAGLVKARVEKRLADIDQLDPSSRTPEGRRSAEFKLGKWVDILKRVDAARDGVSGQWKRTNDGVAGTGPMYTRLMLPVAVDGGYDLQITFVPNPIRRFDRLIVILPIGAHGCAVYVARTSVGIYANQPGAFAGGFQLVTSQSFLANGLPQHVLGISVRVEGDTAKLGIAEDGVAMLSFPCPKDSFDIPTIYALPSPGHPGLGTMETDTAVFRDVKLRVMSGKASWAEAPAANKPAEAPGSVPSDPASR